MHSRHCIGNGYCNSLPDRRCPVRSAGGENTVFSAPPHRMHEVLLYSSGQDGTKDRTDPVWRAKPKVNPYQPA
ncbi:hypothetical protein SXCC_03048 [Gluconacetobacter sp. SXCC-1]|nr:hypothetical protein SXCC_03048 [Gluconacetobacter sp. SXCC-1]